MTDDTTKKCRLRYGVRFNKSLRTIYICQARHGFMIKHWKCVGRTNEKCPLVIEERTGIKPVLYPPK